MLSTLSGSAQPAPVLAHFVHGSHEIAGALVARLVRYLAELEQLSVLDACGDGRG